MVWLKKQKSIIFYTAFFAIIFTILLYNQKVNTIPDENIVYIVENVENIATGDDNVNKTNFIASEKITAKHLKVPKKFDKSEIKNHVVKVKTEKLTIQNNVPQVKNETHFVSSYTYPKTKRKKIKPEKSNLSYSERHQRLKPTLKNSKAAILEKIDFSKYSDEVIYFWFYI